MLYKKQNWSLDWQRQSAEPKELKGNMLLVEHGAPQKSVRQMSTRCVWPTSVMTSETRVFTRKLTVKAY